MYLTATSTEFLLLQQKLEWLQTSIDWNVALLIGVFGVITVAVIGLQFLSIRSSLQRRVERTIDEKLASAKKELASSVSGYEERFSDELKKQELAFEKKISNLTANEFSNHNRNMAMTFELSNEHAAAAGWWLNAAWWYHTGGLKDSEKQAKMYLDCALAALQKSDGRIWSREEEIDVESTLAGLEVDFPEHIKKIRAIWRKFN